MRLPFCWISKAKTGGKGIYSTKNDKGHCGVKVSEYARAKPILNGINWERFRYYMVERYKARYFQGTKDPIIYKYRFPNVFRDEDMVTRDYIDTIANSELLCYDDKILNTILFRLWNNVNTFCGLGGPWRQYELFKEPDFYIGVAELRYIDRNNRCDFLEWWNPKGFSQSGLRLRYNKAPWKVLGIAKHIKKLSTIERIRAASTQKQVYDILCELPYFGPTLAYQVYLDLTYIDIFPFSEHEFAIVDTDTIKGLKYLFLVSDMRPNAAVYYIRKNFDKILSEVQERFLEPSEVEPWRPREIFSERKYTVSTLSVAMICHNLKGFGKYMYARETGDYSKLYKHL